MKKVLFLFISIIVCASSCSTGTKDKRIVLNYLQKNEPWSTFTIVDISKRDSLYSPFQVIMSLSLSKAQRNYELNKQLSAAIEKPTRIERRAAAGEVAKQALAEYRDCGLLDFIRDVLDNSTFKDKPANRVGYFVTYEVNGVLKEDVFFLETHEPAVGHTASELRKEYDDIQKTNSDIHDLWLEALDLSKNAY